MLFTLLLWNNLLFNHKLNKSDCLDPKSNEIKQDKPKLLSEQNLFKDPGQWDGWMALNDCNKFYCIFAKFTNVSNFHPKPYNCMGHGLKESEQDSI